MTNNVRIGIDVGGTFTHAVAIDSLTLKLLGKTKVPTTHRATEGVARGIIDSLNFLLKEAQISPEDVSFIAHSTTQATNALLEGDVAPVGILGMGKGANAWLARLAINIKHIQLAPGKFLKTSFEFLNTSSKPTESAIKAAIQKLVEKGAQAIAISEAFSPDEPSNELFALNIARQLGIPATAGSEVSQLYGLTVRTRTAVINASMLPKMIESADMTESSVRKAGIKAPLMIMRSDGGIMDIATMRQRPIQSMLSGPAAGVAAAMMYLHISDGIFLEVGGTSTDISAIKNGRAQIKSAEVGGHRLYMRTLDVRTAGVAGGSIPRLSSGQLIDIGPRSAHIAGLRYASFVETIANPIIKQIKPQVSDPADYVAISEDDTTPEVSITPTCASNFLQLVPPDNCATGNIQTIRIALQALSKLLHKSEEETAKAILTLASSKLEPLVSSLVKEYKLDPDMITLVGGGGGSAALVPFLGQTMALKHTLAQNADVISAIGVALALVRETVERQIINPDSDDILKVRQEAQLRIEKMGADPASIEVHIEVDSRNNIVRATANGATSLVSELQTSKVLSEAETKELVATSMRVAPEKLTSLAKTSHFQVFEAVIIKKHFGGLLPSHRRPLRIIDNKGIIRLQTQNGLAHKIQAQEAERALVDLAEEHAHYGDAGKIIPGFILLAGPKIIDFSGLHDIEQVVALARVELTQLPSKDDVIIIVNLS